MGSMTTTAQEAQTMTTTPALSLSASATPSTGHRIVAVPGVGPRRLTRAEVVEMIATDRKVAVEIMVEAAELARIGSTDAALRERDRANALRRNYRDLLAAWNAGRPA